MTSFFKTSGLATFALVVGVSALCAEDKLQLDDGSILSGKVLSIQGNDKVVLDSNLTNEPIHLRAQSLTSITSMEG